MSYPHTSTWTVEPGRAPAATGNQVYAGLTLLVLGTDMHSTTSVTIGGHAQTFIIDSPTAVYVHVNGAARSGAMTFTGPDGSSDAGGEPEVLFPGPWFGGGVEIVDLPDFETGVSGVASYRSVDLVTTFYINSDPADPDAGPFGGRAAFVIDSIGSALTGLASDDIAAVAWVNGRSDLRQFDLEYSWSEFYGSPLTSGFWEMHATTGLGAYLQVPAWPADDLPTGAVLGEEEAPAVRDWDLDVSLIELPVSYDHTADPFLETYQVPGGTLTVKHQGAGSYPAVPDWRVSRQDFVFDGDSDLPGPDEVLTPASGDVALLNPLRAPFYLHKQQAYTPFVVVADSPVEVGVVGPTGTLSLSGVEPVRDFGLRAEPLTVDLNAPNGRAVPLPDWATGITYADNTPIVVNHGTAARSFVNVAHATANVTIGRRRYFYATPQRIAPLRQTRRDDGVRQGRRSSSKQASVRQGWASTYL